MKISVVTNAYNQAGFLAAAVESVLTQSGADIEYVIVEPGSTDETPRVIAALEARYPGRFTVLRENDSGPADGLNNGFAHCTGDWFIYLNADDAFLPGAFAGAARAIRHHPQAGAIIGSGYLVEEDGAYIRRAISTRFDAKNFVTGYAFALQQSTFYRAEAFRAVGGFNVVNRTSWDAEILLHMERAGYDRVTVPGYWSLFRMQPNSITVSQTLAEESRKNHRRFFNEVMGRDPVPADARRRKLATMAYRLTHPADGLARVIDHIAPPKRRFAEALSPAWLTHSE